MDDAKSTLDERLADMTAGGESVQTDWRGNNQPLVAIAEAVAAFLNVPPSELPPLGRVVDGDALKQLLTGGNPEANPVVSFEYQGLEITITHTEILIIEPAPTAGH